MALHVAGGQVCSGEVGVWRNSPDGVLDAAFLPALAWPWVLTQICLALCLDGRCNALSEESSVVFLLLQLDLSWLLPPLVSDGCAEAPLHLPLVLPRLFYGSPGLWAYSEP